MKTFVLDSEAVAFDVKESKLMPFQELSKRKRKDVKVEDIQVKVCLFAFDLLYLNGEVSSSSSLHASYSDRRGTALATKVFSRTARPSARVLPNRRERVPVREIHG